MGKRLVRDNALQSWRVPGAEHQVRPVADAFEHSQLLKEKLLEECGEVIFAEPSDLLKELSDVIAVVEGIATVHGFTFAQVIEKAEQRALESGRFVNGLVWETER